MRHFFLLCFMVAPPPGWARDLSPAPGTAVPDLAAALALAQDGDVVLVSPGLWTGNFRIEKAITLRGMGGRLNGAGKGTVLTVLVPGVVLEDLDISGGGSDLRGPDCGIYVGPLATGAVIRNNRIGDVCFGIWVHRTRGARIEGNHIQGAVVGHTSNRGNGIHLFDASELVVKGNQISGGRDGIYISATEDSLIEANNCQKLRYGIHYMYSYDNRLINNISENNIIGFALMESRNLTVVGNQARHNVRQGLLFRDAQYCTIRKNILEGNGEGLFFFSSTDNLIVDNRVIGNTIGAKIWAGSYDNDVRGNAFIGNGKQVFYVGTADLEWGVSGPGNYFSDYLGWDQDGDGLGDRPYRVENFSGKMVYRYPASAILLRSPAVELLSYLERALPIFRVPTVVDKSPAIEDKERTHEND